ncbi:Fusaric acid resistance protein family-domain-containing protein [Kockovaella imperatae]|uniref:Fusaric acid resistance protein family-domain-containing protein n=1 Tax=Kockovaella imperatae TaxID=4999 RepID=A0A1Y1UV94_9TREE|nr:Fusaric acid resistance protein family-domain-containing protein [Kockovaella imperatae]ORX41135.1 Fusaric acid resistance protein family-domain-containing protein [Kockovaella imperatae]
MTAVMDADAVLSWRRKVWRLTGTTISAFLCFTFVVIRPWGSLGGQYSYLTFTALNLFFFPLGGIIYQVELTILGLLGCLFGLGISCATLAVSAWCGTHYGPDSNQSRAVIGTGLALLSLICGFLRSYSPRLTLASRISLFFPIFVLTGNTDITMMHSSYFTEVFFVPLFAAIFALIPTFLFAFRPSSPRVGTLLIDSLDTIGQLLPLTISLVVHLDNANGEIQDHFTDSNNDAEAEKQSPEPNSNRLKQDFLVRRLRHDMERLSPVYTSLTHEITRSRSSPLALRPLISSLKRMTRNPLLGPGSHVPGERIQSAIDKAYASVSVPPSVPQTPRQSHFSIHPSDSMPILERGNAGTFSPVDLARGMQASLSLPRHMRFDLYPVRDRTSIRPVNTHSRLMEAAKHLVETITKSLRRASEEVSGVYGWKHDKGDGDQASLQEIKSDLEFALAALQVTLAGLLDGSEGLPLQGHEQSASTSGSPSRTLSFADLQQAHHHKLHGLPVPDRELFHTAFYMTALLDCANDVIGFLSVAIEICSHAEARMIWHFPRFNLGWLPQTAADTSNRMADQSINTSGDSNDKSIDATHEPACLDGMDFVTSVLRGEKRIRKQDQSFKTRITRAWRRIWDHPQVLKGRVRASRFLHSIRHSRHILFSVKMALGVSLISLAGFLPPSTPGRQWFDTYRGAWAVISYTYVLETHTGATLRVGLLRLLGTFIGAVTAFILDLICRDRPWPMVVLLTACSVPLSYGILFSSIPQLPTVTAITLPPLVFIHFLGLDRDQSSFELAYTRFIDITIGIIAAILIGSLIWPNHARVRYFSDVSLTLDRITEYYLCMSRDNLRSSLVYHGDAKRYDRLEAEVRKHILRSRSLVNIQRNEVSLLPRPIKLYSEILDCSERLIDTLVEVRVLRFSVPRKETVLDVLPLRRELVSAILINLWALGQSFRSRSPLPQFLPSPHVPLKGIMEAVDEHAKTFKRYKTEGDQEGESHCASPGGHREELAILYGMAENDALVELCNLLDELIAAAHALFGTRTFLDIAQDSWQPRNHRESAGSTVHAQD